jgi:hypothetical protein
MTPTANNKIMSAVEDLTNRIEIGQKHIRSEDRQNNIKVTKGLIRDQFTVADVAALCHGPGMIFDFENSIRRSRTETARYEFKQGLLRLDDTRHQDPGMIPTILAPAIAVLKPLNVILRQDRAGLDFDKDNVFHATVGNSVDVACVDMRGLAGRQVELALAERDPRHACHHRPLLGAVTMPLQRQNAARRYPNALDHVARARVEHRPVAPRTDVVLAGRITVGHRLALHLVLTETTGPVQVNVSNRFGRPTACRSPA